MQSIQRLPGELPVAIVYGCHLFALPHAGGLGSYGRILAANPYRRRTLSCPIYTKLREVEGVQRDVGYLFSNPGTSIPQYWSTPIENPVNRDKHGNRYREGRRPVAIHYWIATPLSGLAMTDWAARALITSAWRNVSCFRKRSIVQIHADDLAIMAGLFGQPGAQ